MRRRPARVGGFLPAPNGGKNLDFLRNLLERSLFGQTRNGLKDSLLVRHKIIIKRRIVFARESFFLR